MEQKAFLQELGYEVIPVLYVIETKRIAVTSSSNGLLKYINRASARGQKRIFRKLKATELKTLEELNIACTPCKYKINLS